MLRIALSALVFGVACGNAPRVVFEEPGLSITELAGTSPDDVWAAGIKCDGACEGVLLQWDGVRFTRLRFDERDVHVWSGAGEVFRRIGDQGLERRAPGGEWTSMGLATRVQNVASSSPDDIWATASFQEIALNPFDSSSTEIHYWNGREWIKETIEDEPLDGLLVGSGDVWLNNAARVRRREGDAWQVVRSPSGAIVDLARDPSGVIWALTTLGLFSRSGDWHRVAPSAGPSRKLFPLSEGRAWSLSDRERGVVSRWNGNRWSEIYEESELNDFWSSGPTDLWLAGEGVLMHPPEEELAALDNE